jgi:hypothetical protein
MKTPLTPQEKAAKKAAAKAAAAEAEAKRKAEEEAYRVAFRKSVPWRLAALKEFAEQVGVTTELSLTSSGPQVRFFNEGKIRNFDETLTYDSDEWDIEWMETQVGDLRREQDAREARRALATSAFDKLSLEEQVALKEFIHYLR